MPKLSSLPVQSFLKKLGSAEPAPGGGAAAALVLAQAEALGEMVARLNAKRAAKKGLSPASSKNVGPFARDAKKFLALLEKDAAIFKTLSRFDAKGRAGAAYQSALKKAAGVPLEMCGLAGEGSARAASETGRTSRWLYSDLVESAILFEAGFAAARLNVEINLDGMKDKNFVKKTRSRLDSLAARIKKDARRVSGGRP